MKHIKQDTEIRNAALGGMDYTSIKVVKVDIGAMSHFVYFNNVGNCKTCTIAGIQHPLEGNADKTVARLKEFFKDGPSKLVFKATFNSMFGVNVLKKHFPLISLETIPIGYGGDDQYHATFLTGNTRYSSYVNYQARISARLEKKKKRLNKKGEVTFKKEEIDKILSYKRISYLQNYVKRLVNGENL